ncbi:hypothetical protein P7K49_013206 [Saguinus oedipus]|uniref:Uncharacterized protein n=1 Tax=Saguinus oedipus TaxID=9490 RepID=A0ABQ9VF84_SAGOE|nr:hypothetical protein P7K49_013206 [Saguinus oedipus]
MEKEASHLPWEGRETSGSQEAKSWHQPAQLLPGRELLKGCGAVQPALSDPLPSELQEGGGSEGALQAQKLMGRGAAAWPTVRLHPHLEGPVPPTAPHPRPAPRKDRRPRNIGLAQELQHMNVSPPQPGMFQGEDFREPVNPTLAAPSPTRHDRANLHGLPQLPPQTTAIVAQEIHSKFASESPWTGAAGLGTHSASRDIRGSSAPGRRDSIHRHTDPRSSCYYDNFIFTVKTSRIPRETERQPSCCAVSCGCWSQNPPLIQANDEPFTPEVNPRGRTEVQAKKAEHSEAEATSSGEEPPALPGLSVVPQMGAGRGECEEAPARMRVSGGRAPGVVGRTELRLYQTVPENHGKATPGWLWTRGRRLPPPRTPGPAARAHARPSTATRAPC